LPAWNRVTASKKGSFGPVDLVTADGAVLNWESG